MKRSLGPMLVGALFLAFAGCGDVVDVDSRHADSPTWMLGGEPDTDRYPQVCAIVGNFGTAGGPVGQRCSGVLVAPNVMLTAAHCAVPVANYFTERVTCEADALGGSQRIAFTGVPHPEFVRAVFGARRRAGEDNFDIGVLLLEEEVPGARPAGVVQPGFIDKLYGNCGDDCAPGTAVGFGATARGAPGAAAAAFWPGRGFRHSLVADVVDITPFYLRYEMVGCFGDSGGPVFQAGTGTHGGGRVLGTLTSIPDTDPPHCDPVTPELTWYNRWDTPSARAFLSQFIDLR